MMKSAILLMVSCVFMFLVVSYIQAGLRLASPALSAALASLRLASPAPSAALASLVSGVFVSFFDGLGWLCLNGYMLPFSFLFE
ncbi:hypothetical protein ISN45_At01g008200 [Arabidopsis thaliana x Arabidopsis arenosa]|uniref:Transmembrane protein n=1 Tax=Arabidopsis thaliana x Arabidopsis arenosa TaxID=1240361 RepID=A0A8T2GA98_9BRAS|nr:hypothetical protein ISN45_At01g008200 [Arabidopsis thaliana x Arabidopsis arenosa]